jgi:hypothetical protein
MLLLPTLLLLKKMRVLTRLKMNLLLNETFEIYESRLGVDTQITHTFLSLLHITVVSAGVSLYAHL